MKILFICHRIPYPPDHGAKIRAYHFVRHLSENHSVTVATLAEDEQELGEALPLKQLCEEVIAEVLPERRRWLQAVEALISSTPSSVAYFRSGALQKRIEQSLKSKGFDAIIVFCAFMAQYVVGWNHGYRILDYGDLDSAKWREYSQYKAFPISWGYAIEAAKLRRYERSVGRYFHRCSVVSQGELEEFANLNISVPCTVIPNGVDASYFSVNGKIEERPPAIVFVGRMDYFPNVDGIIYFTRRVFPIIREKRPDVELRIIGSNPTKAIRELAKMPNIVVTGYVHDVRTYMGDAAVSIAPLRIARGTQNKILEAMAMGIPVVATPQAAKGIVARAGDHLLVEGEPEAFARQVVAVMENLELRRRLTEAGRTQVETAHGWESCMEILDETLSMRTRRQLISVGR